MLFVILSTLYNMKKSMRFLKSPVNVLMIVLVAGMFIGNIPAHAGSPASSAIMQYEKGMITEAELDQRLRDLQYSEEEIRQVKGVMGNLEHQQEGYVHEDYLTQEKSEPKPDLDKSEQNSGDNLLLAMAIGGIAAVAAIALAFSKKVFTI
ncbi:MAG: hypothetical protein ACE5EJ_01905 [Nitrosopumilaceae archaeon]